MSDKGKMSLFSSKEMKDTKRRKVPYHYIVSKVLKDVLSTNT